jgi:hypothetical protein
MGGGVFRRPHQWQAIGCYYTRWQQQSGETHSTEAGSGLLRATLFYFLELDADVEILFAHNGPAHG